MIEPLEDLLAHAKSIEVKRAARKALLALGLTDREIDCRKPIKSILLLEPNAFFRNRLVPALESAGQTMDVAATRQEAQAILSEKRVDLLISESHDVAGALWMWLEAQWRQRKFRYLLLSTANHDLGSLGEKPWVIGRLYKPYPLDDLIKAIEE
jgi:DNA-binding NtrC family response regulator